MAAVLVISLLVMGFAGATEIMVAVSKTLQGSLITSMKENISIAELDVGFHNTGSVSYKARARLDVLNGTDIIFTGWSDKKTIVPGDRKDFKIYWYGPNMSGTFPSVARVYYANEITEPEAVNITIESRDSRDVFRIYDFKTYDDYMRIDIEANETAKDVVVFLSVCPKGFICEQAEIAEIKAGKSAEVMLPYQTDLFYPDDIGIAVVTKDGSFYKDATFRMDRLTGLSVHINLFLDWLKNVFRF